MTVKIDGVAARPCVGCGYCCKEATCIAGGGGEGRCKHLVERDHRYWCNLVLENPTRAEAFGIGDGCCSPLNSERQYYLE